MNFCQRDIPGASLNRWPPAYETYWSRFDATRKALCIACIEEIIGLRGKLGLCTLGSPYRMPGRDPIGLVHQTAVRK